MMDAIPLPQQPPPPPQQQRQPAAAARSGMPRQRPSNATMEENLALLLQGSVWQNSVLSGPGPGSASQNGAGRAAPSPAENYTRQILQNPALQPDIAAVPSEERLVAERPAAGGVREQVVEIGDPDAYAKYFQETAAQDATTNALLAMSRRIPSLSELTNQDARGGQQQSMIDSMMRQQDRDYYGDIDIDSMLSTSRIATPDFWGGNMAPDLVPHHFRSSPLFNMNGDADKAPSRAYPDERIAQASSSSDGNVQDHGQSSNEQQESVSSISSISSIKGFKNLPFANQSRGVYPGGRQSPNRKMCTFLPGVVELERQSFDTGTEEGESRPTIGRSTASFLANEGRSTSSFNRPSWADEDPNSVDITPLFTLDWGKSGSLEKKDGDLGSLEKTDGAGASLEKDDSGDDFGPECELLEEDLGSLEKEDIE